MRVLGLCAFGLFKHEKDDEQEEDAHDGRDAHAPLPCTCPRGHFRADNVAETAAATNFFNSTDISSEDCQLLSPADRNRKIEYHECARALIGREEVGDDGGRHRAVGTLAYADQCA